MIAPDKKKGVRCLAEHVSCVLGAADAVVLCAGSSLNRLDLFHGIAVDP